MEQHRRDLGSAELWDTSLERSRRRRTLADDGRRTMARRKQASGAVTAAMLLTPVLQVGGAMAAGKGKSQVAQSSPANRAIDSRTLNVVLEEGDTGTRVAQLQQLVGVDADGIFGPRTAAAVRSFQARAGLAVDGIVGASTWRVLLGSSGKHRGVAADSVIDGKGYQVTVSKASKAEAEIAGKGNGPVAKIVLTRAETGKADSGSGERRSKAHERHESSESRGGPTPAESETIKDETAPRGSTTPAVDTGDTERVACGSGRLTNPVKGTKTSNFGPRGGRNHDGVDISAPTGTPVHAAACGVVTTVASQSGYGNIVCIDHGSGFTTCYAHLNGFNTRQGQQVHAGDVIGYVGSTGRSTGPHLHFETRVNGQARNPDPYLSGSQRAPGSRSRTTAAKRSPSGSGDSRTRSSSSTGGTQTESSSAAAPSEAKPGYQNPGRQASEGEAQAAPAPAPEAAPAEQQAAAAPAPDAAEAAAPAPAPVQQAAPAPQTEAPAPPAPAPVQQAAPAPQTEAPAAPAEAPAAPAAEAPAAPAADTAAAPAAPAEQPVAAAAG